MRTLSAPGTFATCRLRRAPFSGVAQKTFAQYFDPNRTLRAPRGGNCGILRQTRWDGSMKRRTLKWHLLLVLSVLVSSPGSTTAQNGLASPPLKALLARADEVIE